MMGEYNTYEGDYQKDERGHSSKKTKRKENADTVKGTSQEKYASSTAEQKASQKETPEKMPYHQLAPAIIVTLFCCQPLGIFAIIKAIQAKRKWSKGDQQGAIEAAQLARKLSISGVIVGAVMHVLFVLFSIFLAAVQSP